MYVDAEYGRFLPGLPDRKNEMAEFGNICPLAVSKWPNHHKGQLKANCFIKI